MTTIKGIIFDYGKVLSLPQDETCVRKILELLGRDEIEALETVYYHYRNEYDGGCSASDYWGKVLRHLGVAVDQALISRLIELDTQSWVRLNPEMLELLGKLKKQGFKLALISNMPSDILDYMKREFPWLSLFDQLVFSCELKLIKPDPRIFQYCLGRLQLAPSECLFIDDLPANIAGARQCGLHTICFTNREQLAREFLKYLEPGLLDLVQP